MIPELGNFALILAIAVALALSTVPLVGVSRGNRRWADMSGPLTAALFALIALAYACLTLSFINDDFSVVTVANSSNSLLPIGYKISGVWGNHEGSLLLWVLVLAGWALAVALFSRNLPHDVRSRVLAVLGMVSVGFLLFIVLTSNPFERNFPNVPADGRDLNPLLQDIGLILHPPMLYLGYVGFAVAFAFASAALLGGRLDSAWARWARPWTTAAWGFLTVGIALGSWWAYYELGWGGWWFWDPVENASFMPWLAGTALMHSLAVTEKRGLFKSWTVLLAILTFSLSLLGTFLVRSGVLTSVHAFATDPARGMFILLFLAVVVGASLTLYALRAPKMRAEGEYRMLSRESAILGNNVLLTVAMGTVLVGTLYPLLITSLDLGRLSVGPPFFNITFLPLMSLLILLMAVGPLLSWREDRWPRLRRMLPVAALSLVSAVVLPFVIGDGFHPGAALTIALTMWLVLSLLQGMRERLRSRGGLAGLSRLGLGYWGMFVAHLGMAVCAAGVGLTSVYTEERDVRMVPGDETVLEGYLFRFATLEEGKGPNYFTDIARFEVGRVDGRMTTVIAEKRRYKSQMSNVMTEAGIDAGLFRDLFVTLGEPLGGDAWAVRVHVKPFVRWIWLGSLLMALGGAVAIADRRYQVRRRQEAVDGRVAAGGSPA
jgi:cytochrome c-type biogenesis protein CcmF